MGVSAIFDDEAHQSDLRLHRHRRPLPLFTGVRGAQLAGRASLITCGPLLARHGNTRPPRRRGIIWELPGFCTGDALASAVLTAAAPRRMAVYDRRVQHALDALGLTFTPAPGRYGRYLQLLDDLLHRRPAHADDWTARDLDTALYWTGNPRPAPSP